MRDFLKIHLKIIMLCILLFISNSTRAYASKQLIRLKQAYPDYIQSINNKYIIWNDGTKMLINSPYKITPYRDKLDSPSLTDQLNDMLYPTGKPQNFSHYKPKNDAGRVRYIPFFQKMYGQSKADIESKLTTIYWLPKIFGNKYPLTVTTINSIDKKLKSVSDDLELLALSQPKYLIYLDQPSGVFFWRNIKNSPRISPHSFGIALDLNTTTSNYWQDELEKAHKAISENAKVNYQNKIPWEIVSIFEKHGFIWGGKWYHYDTMHFEYRPELLSR